MAVLTGILLLAVAVLAALSWLEYGMFRVSVLDRRDRRGEELAFLSRHGQPGQTVFLGDSITQYCPVEEIYGAYTRESGSLVYNRGIASETSADALKRLEGSVLALKPEKLIILLGCNDIGKNMTAGQTVANIQKMIEEARKRDPNIRILLQAIYPIREKGNGIVAQLLIGGRTCEKIKAWNAELKKLAEVQNVEFVDFTDSLADENGQLKKEFTQDGLHVNELAYQQIAARLTPILKEM